MHGGTFIAMKTSDGAVRVRAARAARRVAPVTALLVLAFIAWTHVKAGGGAFLNPVELLACIAVIAAGFLAWDRREGWAFAATALTIAISVVAVFVDLYPRVMVSSISPAYDLTVHNTASPPYTLKVMTVVALVLLPVVLGYQAWSYYVFRKRITAGHVQPAARPGRRGRGAGGSWGGRGGRHPAAARLGAAARMAAAAWPSPLTGAAVHWPGRSCARSTGGCWLRRGPRGACWR